MILAVFATLAGCASYTFEVKEDKLSRKFIEEKFGIPSGKWYMGIVPDSRTLAEYTDCFRTMIKKYPVMNMTDEEGDARLKDFTFVKYQYLFFQIGSAAPVINLYDNYRFNLYDNAQQRIEIADTLYLSLDTKQGSSEQYISCWIIRLANPLTRKYHNDREIPVHFVVTDPTKGQLELLIGF